VSDGGAVRITGVRGSISLPVHINSDVARGTVLVPFNHAGPGGHSSDVRKLIDATQAAIDVRIEVGP
jgi:predicted molibdopterin-dependent oxidoreductase YjgC